MTEKTKEGATAFLRIVQTAAIGVVAVFLMRFIGSVDKLRESVDAFKIEVTGNQSKSSSQIDYIVEKVNTISIRLDDLQIDHADLKKQFDIHKITGK